MILILNNTVTWIPLFKISSKDFEEDLAILKKVMNSFESKVHIKNGYKFSPEAQFAMGWWFYEIFVKAEFIKKIVQFEHNCNPMVKDERDIMNMIQKQLKQNGTNAKIKNISNSSLFQKYWTWLLK